MLQPGAIAPDVTLHVSAEERRPLSELLDGRPAVLLFFPFAFSSTCTEEMCDIGEDYAAYEELGGKVLGISVDSPYVNRRFAEEHDVPFPILSDFNRQAIRAFDVVRPDMHGMKDVAERAAYVLDADRRILYTWKGEHPGKLPRYEELKSALRGAAGD